MCNAESSEIKGVILIIWQDKCIKMTSHTMSENRLGDGLEMQKQKVRETQRTYGACPRRPKKRITTGTFSTRKEYKLIISDNEPDIMI